jgi:exopolysaccharide biosynthesis polyprenyl glycosylphosphotransferase
MYKQYLPYKVFLIIADLVLTGLLLYTLVILRPMLPGRPVLPHDVMPSPAIYGMVLILWYVLFSMTGVYDLYKIPSFSRQVWVFTSAYLLAVMVFAGLLYFTFRELSRMLVIYFCVSNYATLLLLRLLLTTAILKFSPRLRHARVLIIGATDSGISLALTMLEHHRSVYKLVGFADNDPASYGLLPFSFLGTLDEVPQLVREHEIDIVVVALPDSRSGEVTELVENLDPLPIRLYLVPDMLNLTMLHSEVENFGDLLVVGIREPIIQGTRRAVKRVMDLTISGVILLLTWPILGAIWIIVKLDSEGPGLYKASRIGENGKTFTMLKFRTMYVDADRKQDDVKASDRMGRAVFKTQQDPRVTGVGGVLRRTSLDELPQLINVLKGEMSLVGPRPEQPFITEDYEHWQWQRLSVPPGMTGWWQVSGRSDLPMHLNTQYDLYYVRNYSFFLDIKILLKTILVVLRGKGAY